MGVFDKEYFSGYEVGAKTSSQEFRDKVNEKGTGGLVAEEQNLEDKEEQLPHPVRNFTLKNNKQETTE